MFEDIDVLFSEIEDVPYFFLMTNRTFHEEYVGIMVSRGVQVVKIVQVLLVLDEVLIVQPEYVWNTLQ